LLLNSNKLYSQLVWNISVTNTTCQSKGGHNLDGNNIGTGRINVSVSGGVKPYTYGISGNHTYTRTQNNGYFPQLYVGNYNLTVIDSNGLRKDTIISISSDFPIPAFAKPTFQNPSVCESTDGRIVFPTPSSGVFPFLYSIDGGASFNQDSVFTNLRAGLYMCKVIDGNGCMSFFWPIVIFDTVPCAISANQLAIKTACANDAEPMNVLFNNKIDSVIAYSFDGINYTSLKGNYSPGFNRVDSFANLSPGIHNLYLKDSVHNLSNTAIINIAKSCELYIQFVSVDATCGGNDGALTINASGGTAPYTYSMDGINYQTSNLINGLTSGSYTVTVKDASGALSSAIGTVFNKCPKVSFLKYDDSCGTNGGKIIASAIKGVTPYLYSIDGINYQYSNTFNNVPVGTYKVYVKDANNFKDSSTQTKIIPKCISNTITISNELCSGHNAIVTLKTSGGTKPYTATISDNAGNANNFNYTDSIGIIYAQKAGKYTIRIFDINAVVFTDSIVISNTVPTINLGNDTTLCDGTSLLLSPNLPGANFTWQDNSKNSSYSITKPGNYWVTAKYATCTLTDTIKVNYLIFSNPIFPTKDSTSCIDSTILLNANYPGAIYLWNDNSIAQTKLVSNPGKYWVNIKVNGCTLSDTINCHFISGPQLLLPKDTSFCLGNQVILDPGNMANSFLWNTNETTRTIKVSNAGTYWVKGKALGCTTVNTVNITGNPIPKINLGNDTTLCKDSILVLNVSLPAANYLWSDGSISGINTIKKAGNYSVKVSQSGCDTTASLNVYYLNPPILSLVKDTILCTQQQLLLNVNNPQANYLWQDGSVNPTFTIINPGKYKVTVSNNCGTASDSINVSYKNCACIFSAPNVFSPNGDGINDEFVTSFSCPAIFYNLTIFDRYGMPVYQSSKQGDTWNGTRNGKPVPIGTYYYILKVQALTDSSLSIKSGSITVIK